LNELPIANHLRALCIPLSPVGRGFAAQDWSPEVQAMKRLFVPMVSVAAVLLLMGIAPQAVWAQQVDQDSSSTAPRKSDNAGVPAQHANETHIPSSGETTIEAAKIFGGVVVKENGELALQDPVTKVNYKLDDEAKAKQFLGKRVKVTGKLQPNSNKIR
jgi:hypothetical protein